MLLGCVCTAGKGVTAVRAGILHPLQLKALCCGHSASPLPVFPSLMSVIQLLQLMRPISMLLWL